MRYDVTAMGELLIDFTPQGNSPRGMRLFEQNPGGAPTNVACAVSRLGGSSAFIGKVGEDMHGRFLRETLQAEGVEDSGLAVSYTHLDVYKRQPLWSSTSHAPPALRRSAPSGGR